MKKIHGNSKYHNILTKKFLIKEYIKNKKTLEQIAKKVKCNFVTVYNHLNKNNIRIRTQSETMKGKYIGKKNFNYKGNKAVIRQIHYCKDCGNKIGYSSWKNGLGRCNKCAGEKRKNKARYIKHYCKDCIKKGIKTEIHYTTWNSRGGRCRTCARKKLWQNKEFREKTLKASMKAQHPSANRLERQLNKLLNKLLPKTYKFVGNGKLIVGGFCPDFVNKDNNKIIEMYGCYWHKCSKCGFGNGRSVDVGRLKEYSKLGYKTLIIWEHELKDLDKVEKKILKFHKKIK